MTQIRGFVPPTRQVDALGVHSLDHFCLSVPDLEEARRFFTAFGLDVRARANALDLHTEGHPHRWATLREGAGREGALQYLSFGAFADDLGRFAARLDALGVERITPPAGTSGDGLWFRDCDGTAIEIRVAPKSSPNQKAGTETGSVPAGLRGATPRELAPRVRPRRMSHVLVFARDLRRSIGFYQEMLGLRLSDEVGGLAAFLHGVHGSDHHLLAFAAADAPGYHHSAWDVDSVNAIGLGAMHMAGSGWHVGWGLGRHVPGSNYFHYVRDPWGSWVEYSTDIDYIPVGQDWQPQSHGVENALCLWGPEPPADFLANPTRRRNDGPA
ncbi:Metapyrocatechase 2 [Rhodovastum atsumiense]|uniref:Metapyrocatechase n=1 Tax=Rhodovastum atsumiense TaxID=504468 RepID=A0A5M6ILY4_9PROT|nr:VOC family protein [Rhodovastum atsumiense]KAA5609291.1 metapyrocatechase [Rhodovastum atsumiense]CAH2604590.1 Metapyrocatechase 2 [Rhodovastum atsumiense]